MKESLAQHDAGNPCPCFANRLSYSNGLACTQCHVLQEQTIARCGSCLTRSVAAYGQVTCYTHRSMYIYIYVYMYICIHTCVHLPWHDGSVFRCDVKEPLILSVAPLCALKRDRRDKEPTEQRCYPKSSMYLIRRSFGPKVLP